MRRHDSGCSHYYWSTRGVTAGCTRTAIKPPTHIRFTIAPARPTLSYIDAAITLISISVLKGNSLGFSRRNTLERRRTFRQMSACGLSVCPVLPPHAAAAGLLLWARRAGDIDRLLHGRRSAASCSGRMRAVLRRQLSQEAERRLVPSVSACLTSPFERCCRCRL